MSRSNLRMMAWGALGIAAAAGATGLYFGIKEADKFDEARDLWERERKRSSSNPTPGEAQREDWSPAAAGHMSRQ